jgi:hypothetical protein
VAIPLFIIIGLLALFAILRFAVYQARAFQRRRILAKAKHFKAKTAAAPGPISSKPMEAHNSYARPDDLDGGSYEMKYWKYNPDNK